MRYLIKKWHKAIISVLSVFISAAGLVITIVDLVIVDHSEDWVVPFLVIISTLLLIIASFYNITSILRAQSKKQEFAELRNELYIGKNANRVIYENYKTIVTTYKDCADNLKQRISTYQRACADIDQHGKELEKELPGKYKHHTEDQREKENSKLSNALITEYNIFIGNITNTLRRSIEEYLTFKGCKENVSITLKQLEFPVTYRKINKKNPNVYTAFRDYRTYSSKSRNETWDRTFKISKNSDFINSIEKDYFIFNFMTKKSLEDGLYQNENATFYEHYNSGVTCTVYSCISGERKLYGYIACDSLFDDQVRRRLGESVFDWNVANILMHGAQIIALYLEEFLECWEKYYEEFDKTKTFKKLMQSYEDKKKDKQKKDDEEAVSDAEENKPPKKNKGKTSSRERRDFCYTIKNRVKESRYGG